MFPLLPLAVAGGAVVVGAVAVKNQRSTRTNLAAALGSHAAGKANLLADKGNGLVGDLVAKGQRVVQSPPAVPQNMLVATLRTTASAIDEGYQHFMHRHFDRLFGAERDQQMQEISEAGGGIAISPYEKRLNHNVAVSIVMTGVAWAAAQHPVVVVVVGAVASRM